MQRPAETTGPVAQKATSNNWFHTDEEGPFLYDYAVKGFLCEAARTLKTHGKAGSKTEVKQLQDKFKRYVFVRPRRVRLPAIEAEPLERPLRAATAQGPRVCLTRSDVVKAGAKLSFQLCVLAGGNITRAILEDVFEYGEFIGLGQWRSGGHGRIKLVKLSEIKDDGEDEE